MWGQVVGRIYYRYGLFCASHPLKVILAVQVVMFLCAAPYIEYMFTSTQEPIPTKTTAPFDSDHVSVASFAERYGNGPVVRLRHFIIAANASVSPYGAATTADESTRGGVGTAGQLTIPGSEVGVLTKDAILLSMSIVEKLRAFRATIPSDGRVGASSVGAKTKTYALDEFCFHQPGEDCVVVSPATVFGTNLARYDADADLAVMLGVDRHGLNGNARAVADAVVWGIKRHANGTAYSAGALCILVALRHMPAERLGVENEFFRQFLSTLPSDVIAAGIASTSETPMFPVDGAADLLLQDGHRLPTSRVFYEFRDEERGSADIWFLVLSYAIVFLYISFSIGKFHLVKSKFGLGFTAVVIVFCSMVMSVGICTALGVPPTLMSIEVIPFLVIAIGVENIFVITNSVVSTSLDLPVKIRIAEGMSQVGGSITMSLLTELALVIVGMGTSIPTLQEFCY
eukprot:Opistho-2@64258